MSVLDLTLESNAEIGKTLTDLLIKQVTESMVNVRALELESRVKELVIDAMTDPLKQIKLQDIAIKNQQ